MIRDLVIKNRSYRRFDEGYSVDRGILESLVELARFSPSAANLQPLKYIICTSKEKNKSVFNTLSWAGYLKDWAGPEEGERPSGYIIVLGDRSIGQDFRCDAGIACQTILLGAVDKGLGGCMLGSIDRGSLRSAFSIADRFEILYIIAIGRPVESVVLEDVKADEDIKYWRDGNGIHHVPKRLLKDLILSDFSD